MAGRDETSGRYMARPSGDGHEGRDQEREEEGERTTRQQHANQTETTENRGKDTDGAQLQQRPFETPGQPRNRKSLSPVSEDCEKTVKMTREMKARQRQPMSPEAQKEAEAIFQLLQSHCREEMQEEMDRLQDDVKVRKLFENDEMEERSSEEEKADDDGDDDKEGTSGSDDEQEKKEGRRGRDEEQRTNDRISQRRWACSARKTDLSF